jgi:hypothetical protein
MFNSNQTFLLMQILKSAPKGFTLGVKAELEKNNFNLPQGIKNAELYGSVYLAPRLKKEYHPIWEAKLGAMFTHY